VIVVDTSVLSLSFRRPRKHQKESRRAVVFREIILADEPVGIPASCLQEVLSGVADDAQFNRLKRLLSPFPLLLATRETHELAARIFASCRQGGISAVTPDCLIAATAIERRARLFTADQDFSHMQRRCGLVLYDV
jgi:predicted nucleic acid-binding protein